MMVDCLVLSNLFNKFKEVKDYITKLNADICLKNLFYKWFDSLYADGCSFLNLCYMGCYDVGWKYCFV